MASNELVNDPNWVAFCRSHNIEPYETTEDSVDFESTLLQDLQESFRTGQYNYNIPIIVASSKDLAIRNQMIDGRNRVLAVYLLEKRGTKVKFPRIEYEEIADSDGLKLRIAHYVMQSRAKNAQLAKKIVERNVKAVIENRMEKFGDRLPDFIRKRGFAHASITNRLIDEVQSKKRRADGQKRKPLMPRPGLETQWLPKQASQGIQAGAEVDQITNYQHKCPKCRSPLIIVTSTAGAVVSVKHAPSIEK